MLICQKCERAGIRTVQVMPESYGSPGDPGFVYFVPEAVGIVSTGRSTQPVALPALPRVIGGRQFFDLPDTPTDALNIPYRYVLGSCAATGEGTCGPTSIKLCRSAHGWGGDMSQAESRPLPEPVLRRRRR